MSFKSSLSIALLAAIAFGTSSASAEAPAVKAQGTQVPKPSKPTNARPAAAAPGAAAASPNGGATASPSPDDPGETGGSNTAKVGKRPAQPKVNAGKVKGDGSVKAADTVPGKVQVDATGNKAVRK